MPNGIILKIDSKGNVIGDIPQLESKNIEPTQILQKEKEITKPILEVKKPYWKTPSNTVDYIPPSAPKEINENCLEWKYPYANSFFRKCVKFK